jgi:hypothetical protein
LVFFLSITGADFFSIDEDVEAAVVVVVVVVVKLEEVEEDDGTADTARARARVWSLSAGPSNRQSIPYCFLS